MGSKRLATFLVTIALLTAAIVSCGGEERAGVGDEPAKEVALPPPQRQGEMSVEEALQARRSVRDYTGEPLTLAEVSQLLWAAQGTTDSRGFRTTPSAGALYPLEVYVVAGDVTGVTPGVYRYLPDDHELLLVAAGDRRDRLAAAAVGQEWVAEAAVDLVVTAMPERTTGKYGGRGIRYVHMEAGHAAQNLYLQGEALGLGMTVVGAFEDDGVRDIVAASTDEQPLYVIPVGRRE